ncbi:hypothetical protein I3843_16G064400 [Carya illinoinensis]|nr:hypothetical protein I3843_16G064400 [Carya illinoinensis]
MATEILGGGGAETERKVMVAIDESEYSHYALIWVLDNLKESITKSPLVIFMTQPPTIINSCGEKFYSAVSTLYVLAYIFLGIGLPICPSLVKRSLIQH